MNLQKFLLLSCLMCAFGCTGADKPEVINPVAYVDPYIGTGGHGHTFLGVTAPFGAVQIGPIISIKDGTGVQDTIIPIPS